MARKGPKPLPLPAVGEKCNQLSFVKPSTRRRYGIFRCDCGALVEKMINDWRAGRGKRCIPCGHNHRRSVPEVGEKFWRLTFESVLPVDGRYNRRCTIGLFRCSCGKTRDAIIHQVRAGLVKRCKDCSSYVLRPKTREELYPDGTKICSNCKVKKPLEEFHHPKPSQRGASLYAYCKECARAMASLDCILRKYKITEEEYQSLFTNQNSLCGICNRPRVIQKYELSVDHDHKTGEVRGILCARCNNAIGGLNDSIKLLRRAIRYLQNPPARRVLGNPEILNFSYQPELFDALPESPSDSAAVGE